ncbi:branched-chain amino acid ABC transporter, amino acid-binding protein [Streptococcus infantarius subsp. infantarius]|uniref:ABC transporter substrate-binding protein n=1 Tax=Streptococcus infantarius TaxID=102684 RepID=UPI001BD93388|nr:ABC transporter substrate-binding protein [Streptococcus infantarius]MBT0903294.1 ABC transporter substrate-binding protein [Streptococcus infantarius subsp. infantarius]MBT0917215.1 ABC transporter substrate-binding protein [Streptococcus infantarius subsp. infantarius]MBT0931547.1 ABC transporter substrate-binding protein [Streptococcus infantarius subsp. infantarius]MCO4581825.1 branched-chain amino acid ABC transporter, amino acid-binding protein [Streptococcus infantarius subsp. infanta
MHKKIALTALTFLASIALAACSKSPDVTANATGTTIGDTIKVGVNLELTGTVAAYGNAENNGVKLAVQEINKAGGVDGKKIELVTKDNKSENAEASTAATNLTIQSQVNAMIGPATSGAVAAASLNAQKTGVPLLTPSGTQDDLTLDTVDGVKKYVFRTTFQDSFQGQVLAQYAYSNLNAKKVVLYYDNSSDYAKGIAEEFKKKYQGDIVTTATFASGDKDFQSALTKIKNLDYDAIVMPGYYTETGIITKQARDMGISVPILGPDGFNDDSFADLAGKANANSVYYVSGYSTKTALSGKANDFIKAYKAKYGSEPNMFAALSYDSVYMIAKAAEGAKTSIDIANNLAELKDFDGVTGKMTIDKKHNPIKTALMVIMKDGAEVSADAVEIKKN